MDELIDNLLSSSDCQITLENIRDIRVGLKQFWAEVRGVCRLIVRV